MSGSYPVFTAGSLTNKDAGVTLHKLLETLMAATKTRTLNPKTADNKYTGPEPDWTQQPDPAHRQSALMRSFHWYGYHYDKKMVKQLVLDWMHDYDLANHKRFSRVPESALPWTLGWLCRMNQRGLVLTGSEQAFVTDTIAQHLEASEQVRQVITVVEDTAPKVTIQDRLRAKAEEVAAELEGLYDEVIRSGAKMTAEHKPMAIIRGMNLPAQMVAVVRDQWMSRLDELQAVQEGRDSHLVEGYANFSKLQIRNLIKFAEQVLADCASYVQIKRVEKRPRKAKAVSPEHRAHKFKHIIEFAELKLVGLPAAKLIDISEAWLYDVKKRKLIHLVADTHIGSITIKNNMLLGMSEAESQQKTLRKPAETLKALASASKPNARKLFKDIKTTETAFNGRGTENLMILRVW
jgi:hypothetical protein